jgi:hypothetical protein
VLRERHARRDPQLRATLGAQGLRAGAQTVHFGQHAVGPARDHPAVRGQRRAAPGPVHQGQSQLALQSGQPFARRRLGDAERAGRLADAAEVVDEHQQAQ